MASAQNPIIQDRTIDFLLHEVLEAAGLCDNAHFSDHSRETFELYVSACRKYAREVLFDTYKPMDEEAAYYKDGRVHTHPLMKSLYPQLVELGVLTANRSVDVDGQQMPTLVMMAANAYLAAANLSAAGYIMLTTGAAHLIESFGTEELKEAYMKPMYEGRWTGTMALTEPQAGSGLNDVQTRATPTDDGHYLIKGSKVFISGGDNSFSENIVHLALARIDGAPAGTKGISLFVVPRLRSEDGQLVDNDVVSAGTFHKLGWRGIPSIALNFGEEDRCRGYLVGEPNKGLMYMFKMMNEARLGVGANGMATAMVAYESALDYAKNRPQGRKFGHPASSPVVNIIEHADVRRMLLKQKAISEGALALIMTACKYFDLATYGDDLDARPRYQQLLDLLTPVAKTFPAEKGFESNALSVQIHGGYGYTSEYLPESWLRDQKLNSIHEGTTGIQSMDLLGRKILGTGGASLKTLQEEIDKVVSQARETHGLGHYADALMDAMEVVMETTMKLGAQATEDPERAFSHSADYLEMFGSVVIAWQWLVMAVHAGRSCQEGHHDEPFYRGKLAACAYFFNNELPRALALADVITHHDDSYLKMDESWF